MDNLDRSQLEFIQAPVGHIRLLAPAGCGKTLCLLYRCKFLAERSTSKRPRFLIVTFTKAARDELRSRIAEENEFAGLRDYVEISTLNSWGNRRIRNVAFSTNLITSSKEYHFTMRNQLQPVWRHDKHVHVRTAIQNRNQWKSNQAPKKLMDMIDVFKSLGFDHVRHKSFADFSHLWNVLTQQGLGPRLEEQIDQMILFEVLQENVTDLGPNKRIRMVYEAWYGFWREATEHLFDTATFTYVDQKYFAYQDERKNIEQERLLSGAASYDHVFVDEFQDINPLDLALVRAIVERNRATLTIAGDDDQAIYEWRGATPEYILDPDQFFGMNFVTFTLGVNYRAPANIVEHSQCLIMHNQNRVSKRISADSTKSAKIEIKKVSSLSESLDFVNDLLNSSLAQGVNPSQIALIGRKRCQIIPYQIFFASRDIPFCAAEDLLIFLSDTFDRLLRLLDIKNADIQRSSYTVVDDILFLCDFVKRSPIKKKDRGNLRSHLHRGRSKSIIEGIDSLAKYRGELKGKNEEGKMSIDMADAIRSFIASRFVSDALLTLSDNFQGLQRDFGKSEEDIFFTDPPFLQLAEYAKQYGEDYDAFVGDIRLAKDTLVYESPFEDDGSVVDLFRKPIHLMTAHRAKGKEFDKVVVLDAEDGIWPGRRARTPKELEAERRVFYVAFTRARDRVTMLLRDSAVPSPYIGELRL